MSSLAHAGPPDEREPIGTGDLPIELWFEIARHLVLEDFIACAQVSQQWNATWTQPAMAAVLCQKFFPISTPHTPQTFATFQKACRKFFRRRHGKHTAVVDVTWKDWAAGLPCYFEPDPIVHPNGQCPERGTEQSNILAYGEGNIVWDDDKELVFIDNLYNRKRKVLRGADWDWYTFRAPPQACAVSNLLLVMQVAHIDHSEDGWPIFIYHLTTNVGVKYVFEETGQNCLDDWLSICTWGEKAFIATGPSSVHILSHNGASLSLVHIINPFLPLGWQRLTCKDGGPRNQHLANFLPHPYDPDGVFIVLAASKSGSELDGANFLVREFSGTTHVATYTCDMWETMRSTMEDIFGKDSQFTQQELEAARARPGRWNSDWENEQDEWPGVYGSDEGVYEVFRFVFKAHNVASADRPLSDWVTHYQVSVTFSTVTKRWGFQQAFIDDGGDCTGDDNDEWIPRASRLRNQQLIRAYYDSYQWRDAMPIITTRDVDVSEEKTGRMLGKRDDLYPLKHENKGWYDRWSRHIHLSFFHDEDFTILWDTMEGDYVVFDFREPESEVVGGQVGEQVQS